MHCPDADGFIAPIYTTDAGKGKGLAEPEPDDGEGNTSDTPTEGTAGDIAEGTGNLVDGLDESIFRQSLQSGMTGHGSSSAPYGTAVATPGRRKIGLTLSRTGPWL
jgi:hypothetical protein